MKSFNSYLKDNSARLNRKIKAYSKSKDMLEISIELVIYKDIICSDKNSVNKYCKYYLNEGSMGG